MRTFVIFPKESGYKVEASTVQSAINKFRKEKPDRKNETICIVTHLVHDIPEQGVVITEAPKPKIHGLVLPIACGACDPEDSKPEHKDVN